MQNDNRQKTDNRQKQDKKQRNSDSRGQDQNGLVQQQSGDNGDLKYGDDFKQDDGIRNKTKVENVPTFGDDIQPQKKQEKPARKPQQPKQKMTIPDSEFDFSASNAKFHKEDLIENEVKGMNLKSDVFYNKSSSFFDNIGTDLKDRNVSERYFF